MRYLDFDLEIGPGTGRSYPLVVRSTEGDARATLQFPYDELALKDKLKDLRIALLQSSQTHRSLTNEEQAVQEFGQQLFAALFAGVAGNLFYASRNKAAQEGLLGVRLRLHIQAPDLTGLPWEYLYDPSQEEYLCLSHNTSVVRYPELAAPLHPLQVVPPLRILGMIASPLDQDRLDIKREKARMEEALKPLQSNGQMELTWLSGQTWEDLQEAMWHGPWHIFHFIGHGGYDKRAEEGVIAFCDEEGQTRLLGARDLARLLTTHRSLRLVVLNACDGAKGGQRDLFSSTAATLAKRGIPAVLAMQEEITDRAAIQLTRTFYRALANGQLVDAAVDDARTAMSVALRHSLEWGTPVLFLRAPDSTLFTLSGTPAPTVQTPAEPATSAQPEPAAPLAQPPPAQAQPAKAKPAAPVARAASPPAPSPLDKQAKRTASTLPTLGAVLLTLTGHTGPVDTVAWSPDGRRLATASGDWVNGDRTARVWDGASGTLLLTYQGQKRGVKAVAWSPDGRRLASASADWATDRTVHLWDAASGQPLVTLEGHKSMVNAVAWSPDGRRLASGSSDRTVQLWDPANGQPLATLASHTSAVYEVAWSPDGRRLASSHYDNTVRLWDPANGQPLATLEGHSSVATSVAWSPDERRLASASLDNTVRLWDAASGTLLATLTGHTSTVNSVAWSPDGRRLASASSDTTVRVWWVGEG